MEPSGNLKEWLISDVQARSVLDGMVSLCDALGFIQQRLLDLGDEESVYEARCINNFLVGVADAAYDAEILKGKYDDD